MTASLKDRITEDMKAAMRSKDAPRLLAIRNLLAAIKQREVDERIVLDDPAVVAVIDKQIKQRKDSIEQFRAAGRDDLVEKESGELAVLQAYLPERLDEAAVEAQVRALVAELGVSGAAALGKVMPVARQRLNGQADMGLVSAVVKRVLAG